MNDMQAFRLVGRVACQQFPPASHTMDDEWQMQLVGQLHLQLEVVDLFRQGNGASPVESTFSDSGDTRMAGQLCKMPIGSKWIIYIPEYLAYGDANTTGQIKPYSTLIFTIELLGIEK